MKKIILYIATSADGFIADLYDDLDWLIKFPNPSGTDYEYSELLDRVDTLVMGGRTFRWLLDHESEWTYKDMDCYVVSRTERPAPTGVKFLTDRVPEKIAGMKRHPGKDIWLMGGGVLNTLLLDNDLIDEIILTVMPVTLGEGIPLFTRPWDKSEWKIIDSKSYPAGVMQTIYRRKHG